MHWSTAPSPCWKKMTLVFTTRWRNHQGKFNGKKMSNRSINADTRQNFDSKYPLIRSKYKNWIAPTFQTTFHYDAHYWINDQGYNLPAGETGFDGQESKLPTYWNTSFSKICLGMKIDQQFRFIVIHKQVDSLYSLIADGQYRATSLGREKWKELIGSQGSLQYNCSKEGFNVVCRRSGFSKARIGIVSNGKNECDSCDSR